MEQTQPEQPKQQDLNSAVNGQKQMVVEQLNQVNGTINNIINSWAQNLVISESIKNQRTEQLNFVIGFVNQLANDGLPPLNQLGQSIQDPKLSNDVLDANNILMTAARSVLDKIKESEENFKKTLEQQQNSNVKPTEAKATEA